MLYEVLAMVEALLASGQTDSLDLRRLPLDPRELNAIRLTLGHGEVEANIQALGLTRLRETAVPGVWWLTQYNQAKEIIGECFEVTLVPEILSSDRGALTSAIKGLRDDDRPAPRAESVTVHPAGLPREPYCGVRGYILLAVQSKIEG